MTELPAFLQRMLQQDDDCPQAREAMRRITEDPEQQAIWEQHAREQSSVIGEAIEVLRELGVPPEDEPGQTSVLVEVDSTLGGEAAEAASAVEFEKVALEFLEKPSHPELLGRLGRYEIERVLGSGGMGVVLKAFDSELHRVVAIKVLAPHLAHHGTARRRFAREAQAAAAVTHPNIIEIHNVETESKIPYLVMQYVAGNSLQRRVDYAGPLAVVDCLRISLQIASGLAAAHRHGLVHRDVKPANILLEEQVERVLLSDFGLARAVDDASLTRTGIVAGTPFYMSPEQAFGAAIDHRSDLFSLGSVMYFMLAGRPPFRASGAMAVLHRICQTKHRPLQEINPEVPLELSQLIDCCLEKEPAKRIQSANELHGRLADLLGALQSGRLALPSAAAQTERLASNTRPRVWRVVVTVGLCCCALLAGLYYGGWGSYGSWQREPEGPLQGQRREIRSDNPRDATGNSKSFPRQRESAGIPLLDGQVYLLDDSDYSLRQILEGRPLDVERSAISAELLRLESDFPSSDTGSLRRFEMEVHALENMIRSIEQEFGPE